MSGKQSAKPRLGGVFFFVRQNFLDFPAPVGAGSPAIAFTSVCQTDRSACIASKPAPTQSPTYPSSDWILAEKPAKTSLFPIAFSGTKQTQFDTQLLGF